MGKPGCEPPPSIIGACTWFDGVFSGYAAEFCSPISYAWLGAETWFGTKDNRSWPIFAERLGLRTCGQEPLRWAPVSQVCRHLLDGGVNRVGPRATQRRMMSCMTVGVTCLIVCMCGVAWFGGRAHPTCSEDSCQGHGAMQKLMKRGRPKCVACHGAQSRVEAKRVQVPLGASQDEASSFSHCRNYHSVVLQYASQTVIGQCAQALPSKWTA